jgi:hypothetical protein
MTLVQSNAARAFPRAEKASQALALTTETTDNPATSCRLLKPARKRDILNATMKKPTTLMVGESAAPVSTGYWSPRLDGG